MAYNTKNYTEQGGAVTHFGGKVVFEAGCTISGFPEATASKVGLVKAAAAQNDSTASDVAGIVADFNSLLSKLRTAGILTSNEPS